MNDIDDITKKRGEREAEHARELDRKVMDRAKHLTVPFQEGLTLSEPEYVGKFQPAPEYPQNAGGETRGWEVKITSPKMFSWVIAEGSSTRFSEPVKYRDLKHGDIVYVETLVGLLEMRVEIGSLGIIVVSKAGTVGRVQEDGEGYAGCPSVMTKGFLDATMKKA